MNEAKMRESIINRYEEFSYMPEVLELYGQSDYLNFGYWDEHMKDQKEACDNLMEKLLSFIPDKRGTILDVACGKGETTAYLLKHYRPENVTGVNISKSQLETARKNAPGCTFSLMSATELEFPDSSFNNIICVEAAFHFYTREKFFKEAFRVLKPGGWLVLSDFLLTMKAERKQETRTEENYVKDLEEYKDILCRAGFSEVEVIDSTEPCFKSHFWHMVCYFHKKFLSGEIDRDRLEESLHHTYRRASEITYYLLISARRR